MEVRLADRIVRGSLNGVEGMSFPGGAAGSRAAMRGTKPVFKTACLQEVIAHRLEQPIQFDILMECYSLSGKE